MRRDFSFTTERGRRARRRLVAATALVIVIFILDALFGGTLAGAIRSLTAGIWSASSSVRQTILQSGYFATHRALARDNALLRDQLAAIQEDAAAYQGLKAENNQLRAFLHMASTSRGITAPVISSFRSSPYGTFLVGAGEADGITEGAIVMSSQDFAIGTVKSVTANTALVAGTFASGQSTDALIGNTAAVVEGRGGGNAVATVPREAVVHEGDSVIAPALGSRQIGIVGHIDASESSAEQTVYIDLPINLSTLRYVYLVPKL